MTTLLSIVLLIQYSICVLLYTHGTLLKHLKVLNNTMYINRLTPGGLYECATFYVRTNFPCPYL